MGRRIGDMRLKGQLIDPHKTYKVAGWAPVAESAREQKLPMVWDVVEQWLRGQSGRIATRQLQSPRITGGLPNPGVVA
jgi:sulfur-oxidizing protein SoxB